MRFLAGPEGPVTISFWERLRNLTGFRCAGFEPHGGFHPKKGGIHPAQLLEDFNLRIARCLLSSEVIGLRLMMTKKRRREKLWRWKGTRMKLLGGPVR